MIVVIVKAGVEHKGMVGVKDEVHMGVEDEAGPEDKAGVEDEAGAEDVVLTYTFWPESPIRLRGKNFGSYHS